MRNIILLAVQAAGKGTLARLLSEKYGYANISMGEVMRNARNDGSERAKMIADCQDKGVLVPFEITLELIQERISQPDCKNGYILDGFPRDLKQAEAYNQILENVGQEMGVVINLTIPEHLIYERIAGRRTCKKCGRTYNVNSEQFRPLQENVCDDCGGELYQRSDDTEEAIRVRVETYFKSTAPLIDFYRQKGVLYEVESIDSDETLKRVEEILKELGDIHD